MNDSNEATPAKGSQVQCNEDLPGNSTKIVDNGNNSQLEAAGSPQYVPAGKKLSSRYRGVCWNKKNKRWQAAINSSGKYLYLGSYVHEEDAARAFDRAAVRIRGNNARINFKFVDYDKELEVHNQCPSPPQTINRTSEKQPQTKCIKQGIEKQSFTRTSIDPPPVRSSPQAQVGWAACVEPITKANGFPMQKNDKSVVGNDCNLWPGHHGAPWEGQMQRISLGLKPVPCHNDEEDMCMKQQQQYSNLFAGARSQHQSFHPNVIQEPSTFAYPQGFHQDRHVTTTLSHHADGPMSTIPSDCQIVKILPHPCGVLSVMYAKPGSLSTAALIWDGQDVHNMGVFTNQMDAQQACVAASSIAVKLAQNMVSELPDTSALSLGDTVDLGQHMLGHPVAMSMDPISETPLIPTTEMGTGRQLPQSSPFLSGSSEIRMISTLPSGDIERYLNLDQMPLPFGENCGTEMHADRAPGQSLPASLGRVKNPPVLAGFYIDKRGMLVPVVQPEKWNNPNGAATCFFPNCCSWDYGGLKDKVIRSSVCNKAFGVEGKLKEKGQNDLTASICQKHMGTLEVVAHGGERRPEVLDWNGCNLREDIADKSTDSAHDDRSQSEMDSNPATTTCNERYPGSIPASSQAFGAPEGDMATSLTLVREKLEKANGMDMSCQERPGFHISGGCIKGSLSKKAQWDLLGNHEPGDMGRTEDNILAKRKVEDEEVDARLRLGTQIKRQRIPSIDGPVLTL